MRTFYIENRQPTSRGAYFPESMVNVREMWGSTQAAVIGRWMKFRLLIGDLALINGRAQWVSDRYSAVRRRNPNIDMIELFAELGQVRGTGLEVLPLSGRIDALSREQVVVQFADGSRQSLPRDSGIGFRNIVTRTDAVWSMEDYALTQVWRNRVQALHTMTPYAGATPLGVQEPWLLRDAYETQMLQILQVAWAEYLATHTPASMEQVIRIEETIRAHVMKAMDWGISLMQPETSYRIPFPDRNLAVQLWEQGMKPYLDYDGTEPWWVEIPQNKRLVEVTAMRRAYATNQKVNITITTSPELYQYDAQDGVDVSVQMITYGPTPYGVGVENPNPAARIFNPYLGVGGGDPWGGDIPVAPPWNVIKSDIAMPEPKLRVDTRLVSVPADVAERLEAALSTERPTLVFENLNQATCPMLVLPPTFLKTQIVPLFGGGRTLQPQSARAEVDGWAVDGTGLPIPGVGYDIFGPTPAEFLQIPATHRPMREAALSEIIPFA